MAPVFICPICLRWSYNPNDAKHRYCGVCGFVDEPFDKAGALRVSGTLTVTYRHPNLDRALALGRLPGRLAKGWRRHQRHLKAKQRR